MRRLRPERPGALAGLLYRGNLWYEGIEATFGGRAHLVRLVAADHSVQYDDTQVPGKRSQYLLM